MRVYRVQNADSYGPYHGNCLGCGNMYKKHADHTLWPPPHRDASTVSCPPKNVKERHGFINEAQLYNWFSEEEFRIFADNGYHVVVLNVEVLVIMANQVLFNVE